MTLENLSVSLESILRHDKSRLHTIGRLFQNSIFYIILVFLLGSLLEDIFPLYNESKPVYLIILEILGQLLLISFIIFYLQKIIDHIPYVGGNMYDSNDISLQYCEQLIILVILVSTQKNLLKKIKYVYETFNKPNTKSMTPNQKKKEERNTNKMTQNLTQKMNSEDTGESPILSSEYMDVKESNFINQRINTYNQDDKLKYVPNNSYSQPIKPLLTSNDFLKDSMVMEYVDLLKKSNDKIESNYDKSQTIQDSYQQSEPNFASFNNPSLSDSNSYGTSISQIPNFSDPK